MSRPFFEEIFTTTYSLFDLFGYSTNNLWNGSNSTINIFKGPNKGKYRFDQIKKIV